MAEMHRGIYGLRFIVQSSVKTCDHIAQQTTNFFNNLREELNQVDKESFKEIIDGLISERKQKFSNIFSKANFHVSEISQHTYKFNKKEEEIEELEKLKLEDCVKLFDKIFYIDRKRLEVHLCNQDSCSQNLQEIKQRIEEKKDMKIVENIGLLKSRMSLYPDHFAKL